MRVAWIGTGLMGRSMAGHVLAAGHRMTVHNRTRARADGLVAAGASWADDPRDAARGADAACVMVGFPDDVESVVLGPAGLLEVMEPGGLLVDFTTSEPELAVRIAEAAAARGIAAIDAPVSGGDVGAREATLSVMVGGTAQAFAQARPLLDLVGTTVVHQGPAGSGQHTKAVNQILIAGTMVGLAEALLYAGDAGLDPDRVLASVGGGAAASWSLAHLAPRIISGDLSPGFTVEHFVKDLGLALAWAERQGLRLPGLALARELYAEAEKQGGGRQGTQALVESLARASGRDWP